MPQTNQIDIPWTLPAVLASPCEPGFAGFGAGGAGYVLEVRDSPEHCARTYWPAALNGDRHARLCAIRDYTNELRRAGCRTTDLGITIIQEGHGQRDRMAHAAPIHVEAALYRVECGAPVELLGFFRLERR